MGECYVALTSKVYGVSWVTSVRPITGDGSPSLDQRSCYDLAFPLLYRVSDSLLIASSYTIQSATKAPCDAEGHGLRVCTLFVYLLV